MGGDEVDSVLDAERAEDRVERRDHLPDPVEFPVLDREQWWQA